ncbi:MAG TPA: hypothetical protein VFE62_00160 [Gemmataceae bacterium]|nr:hypothetical protein [Gemmataceae bacterium]
MNNDRSPIAAGNAWTRFWFTPTPITGMTALRIASGLLFLVWLLSFVGHQNELFSLNGWFDESAYRQVRGQERDNERAIRENKAPQPSLGPALPLWSALFPVGKSETAFQVFYWGSVVVLVLFTLGIGTRITSVLTWVIVVSLVTNPAISYEGDYLLGLLAFYLMIGHLLTGIWNGNGHLLGYIFGPCDQMAFARPKDPPRLSYSANFMMRLIQIHFTILIMISALHKLQVSDWWSGVALWYPLHPPFQVTADSLRAEAASAQVTLFWVSLATYGVLAWQLAFPLFAWRQGTVWRTILLGGAAVGWIGSIFVYKLPLFGPVYCIAALSFLSAEEWAGIAKWMQGKIGGAALKVRPASPTPAVATAGKK